MDLWIRSQDKERLIKPIDFYIEENIDYVNKSSDFNIYALDFTNNDIIIGNYQTKERALEVLDEIQYQINAIANMEHKFYIKAVYEMPKE